MAVILLASRCSTRKTSLQVFALPEHSGKHLDFSTNTGNTNSSCQAGSEYFPVSLNPRTQQPVWKRILQSILGTSHCKRKGANRKNLYSSGITICPSVTCPAIAMGLTSSPGIPEHPYHGRGRKGQAGNVKALGPEDRNHRYLTFWSFKSSLICLCNWYYP